MPSDLSWVKGRMLISYCIHLNGLLEEQTQANKICGTLAITHYSFHVTGQSSYYAI